MKTKPLSEIEQAVETFVTVDCATPYEVFATGEQTRDNNWKCDGWRFAIKGQSFEYFTGTGHREKVRGQWEASYAVKPPIVGLLHSLILDGAAAEQTFAEWCADFSYDVDSRKALATYEACQQGFDKLRKVFTGAQIDHMRELLQDY